MTAIKELDDYISEGEERHLLLRAVFPDSPLKIELALRARRRGIPIEAVLVMWEEYFARVEGAQSAILHEFDHCYAKLVGDQYGFAVGDRVLSGEFEAVIREIYDVGTYVVALPGGQAIRYHNDLKRVA